MNALLQASTADGSRRGDDRLVRFGALKRNWEGLGRRDPLWAVLTDPDKQGGGWDIDQFFRTGIDEIAAVLERATAMGLHVRRHRALDFGCGVGRLTQALGDHFERCDGVDISAPMLHEARHYDRHGGRCTYHLNTEPNLGLFPDQAFDFVYTVLVLQHMEPRYSTGYMQELVRVLAPGGLLVFQVPGERLPYEPPSVSNGGSASSISAVAGPLPASAFHARITVRQGPLRSQAGGRLRLDATVENLSAHVWPARPTADGRCGINVGNYWVDGAGHVIERDDARHPLPHDLGPGERVEVMLMTNAPSVDGDCWVGIDLVQEDVSWFGDRGSSPVYVACRIERGKVRLPPATGSAPPRVGPEPEPSPGTRFSERHPAAFALLRATGLRELYWAWRRGVDRVKTVRDTVIARLKPRIVNWRKRRRMGPHMEMHCVPKAEVLDIVHACGARVVEVEEEVTPGFLSYRYWVVR